MHLGVHTLKQYVIQICMIIFVIFVYIIIMPQFITMFALLANAVCRTGPWARR